MLSCEEFIFGEVAWQLGNAVLVRKSNLSVQNYKMRKLRLLVCVGLTLFEGEGVLESSDTKHAVSSNVPRIMENLG